VPTQDQASKDSDLSKKMARNGTYAPILSDVLVVSTCARARFFLLVAAHLLLGANSQCQAQPISAPLPLLPPPLLTIVSMAKRLRGALNVAKNKVAPMAMTTNIM